MPRPAQFGRPGTPVIPADWETTHGDVIAATFNCTITIGPAGSTPVWNPDTRRTETSPADPVYTGPADIGPSGVSGVGGALLVAEEQIDEQRLEVKIPRASTAAVAVNHVITVTASTNPALVGARFTVTELERADRGFSRIVYAALAD